MFDWARKIWIKCFIALVAPLNLHAAEITTVLPKKKNDWPIILISGNITPNDERRFSQIAVKYPNAFVILQSEGGAIIPALDIGRTIKLRGYYTVVAPDSVCASSCALIWAAGTKKIVYEGGQVGFHAGYLDLEGRKLETGVGNALIGHYFSQLGFGETTVVFATMTPPDEVLWLTKSNAPLSGIDYISLPTIDGTSETDTPLSASDLITRAGTAKSEATTGSALDQNSSNRVRGAETKQDSAKVNLRSPGAFELALRKKGFQAKLSAEDVEMPTMEVGVGGETIVLAFSGCDLAGCSYIQLIDWFNDLTAVEVRDLIKDIGKEEIYSHPVLLDDGSFGLYNYLIIGEDGITLQTLIENMQYFVKTNQEIGQKIIDQRSSKN